MSGSPSSRDIQIKKINQLFIWLTWLVTRQFSRQLQAFGLTQPQYIILVALTDCERTYTMHELADLTFESPSTLTSIIDRLVKAELVRRSRCENDRRTVWVQATRTGRDLINRIEETMMKGDTVGFGVLSEDDLITMERLLAYILIPGPTRVTQEGMKVAK